MTAEIPKLLLSGLELRHAGLTEAVAAAYEEAARVCLDRHHFSPIEMVIDDTADGASPAVVEWTATDLRTRDAWANEIDATELGAYACALGAIEVKRGLVAVRRAETRTGADYYIARPGEGAEDLEECYRFEVSGVNEGSESITRARLKTKIAQAAAGDSNLPAIAAVVGFQIKLTTIGDLETE